MEIESTSVIVTMIIQRYTHNSLPTSELQIDCSFAFNNGLLFFSFGNGTSTIGVLSGVHSDRGPDLHTRADCLQ